MVKKILKNKIVCIILKKRVFRKIKKYKYLVSKFRLGQAMCNLHSIFSGAFVEPRREPFSRTSHSSSDEPRDTFRLHLNLLDVQMLLNFANF